MSGGAVGSAEAAAGMGYRLSVGGCGAGNGSGTDAGGGNADGGSSGGGNDAGSGGGGKTW